MVHWVYMVECEDNYLYIGTTKRLYRRFNEHIRGNGSVNTGEHKPLYLVGLYKVSDNYSFLQYRNQILKKKEYNKFTIQDWGNGDDTGNLEIENHITEMCMFLRGKESEDFALNDGEWRKVRGGKYTSYRNVNPVENVLVEDIIDRPCCDCEYPCEVKLSKDKKYIYFVCSMKNVSSDFDESYGLRRAGGCGYYKIYDEDSYIKKQFEILDKKMKESWISNIPLSRYKVNPEPCISCEKTNYLPIFNNGTRRACYECLENKYDELKKKYSKAGYMFHND